MAKGLSYTQRTLRALREQGRICASTEKWNPFGGPMINGKRIGIRQDLFGFIDVLCLDPQQGFVAVQSTGPSGMSLHRKSILENPNAYEWLKIGGKIEIYSWRKLLVNRQGKLKTWQPKIVEIILNDFDPCSGLALCY
jgi:hypothetical protein